MWYPHVHRLSSLGGVNVGRGKIWQLRTGRKRLWRCSSPVSLLGECFFWSQKFCQSWWLRGFGSSAGTWGIRRWLLCKWTLRAKWLYVRGLTVRRVSQGSRPLCLRNEHLLVCFHFRLSLESSSWRQPAYVSPVQAPSPAHRSCAEVMRLIGAVGVLGMLRLSTNLLINLLWRSNWRWKWEQRCTWATYLDWKHSRTRVVVLVVLQSMWVF